MRSREGRARRAGPLVLLPWLVYVGVTVVAPAANGAAREPGFGEHAIITLGVSGAVLVLWLAARRARRAARAARSRRSAFAAHVAAPPLQEHHVAPAAQVPAEALAHAEHAEAAGFVQRQARRILGKDPGLERPDAGLL